MARKPKTCGIRATLEPVAALPAPYGVLGHAKLAGNIAHCASAAPLLVEPHRAPKRDRAAIIGPAMTPEVHGNQDILAVLQRDTGGIGNGGFLDLGVEPAYTRATQRAANPGGLSVISMAKVWLVVLDMTQDSGGRRGRENGCPRALKDLNEL